MTKNKRNYPARRVVELAECRELRRYAQSKSGQSDSQRTLPPDSRSIAMASASEHDREPYATLLKCPAEVPQRSANERRSATVIDFQKVFRSMADYRHMVLKNATPHGGFTNWWSSRDNLSMDKPQIRRENLRRYVDTRLSGNNSRLSRLLGNESTTYVNDLLREGSTKSFGEKVAAKIEEKIGLQAGQLDIPNSPLLMDERKRDRLDEDISQQIAGLTREEKMELAEKLNAIYSKRRRTRRAS